MIINQSTIEIVRGSVIEQDVEAIVNAANTMMRGGGGIDGAIHQKAGPRLLEELRRVAPKGAHTGEVVVTKGHDLKQPFILHTPGPIYRNYTSDEAAHLLAACYRNCLEAAEAKALQSIGFCSIATGVYGYPLEAAAPIALQTTIKYFEARQSPIRRVVFALFGAREYEVFCNALQALEA